MQAAAVYSILKEYDIALDYLAKIKHLKSNYTAWMLNNPDFNNLKDDKKFIEIVTMMKSNSVK